MLFLWYYSTYLNISQHATVSYCFRDSMIHMIRRVHYRDFHLNCACPSAIFPIPFTNMTHTHSHIYILLYTIITYNLANRVLCFHRALHPEVMMNVLLAFGKFIFGRYLRAPSMTSSCVAMQQGSQLQHSQALSGEKDGENQWWEKSFTIGHAKTE